MRKSKKKGLSQSRGCTQTLFYRKKNEREKKEPKKSWYV